MRTEWAREEFEALAYCRREERVPTISAGSKARQSCRAAQQAVLREIYRGAKSEPPPPTGRRSRSSGPRSCSHSPRSKRRRSRRSEDAFASYRARRAKIDVVFEAITRGLDLPEAELPLAENASSQPAMPAAASRRVEALRHLAHRASCALEARSVDRDVSARPRSSRTRRAADARRARGRRRRPAVARRRVGPGATRRNIFLTGSTRHRPRTSSGCRARCTAFPRACRRSRPSANQSTSRTRWVAEIRARHGAARDPSPRTDRAGSCASARHRAAKRTRRTRGVRLHEVHPAVVHAVHPVAHCAALVDDRGDLEVERILVAFVVHRASCKELGEILAAEHARELPLLERLELFERGRRAPILDEELDRRRRREARRARLRRDDLGDLATVDVLFVGHRASLHHLQAQRDPTPADSHHRRPG